MEKVEQPKIKLAEVGCGDCGKQFAIVENFVGIVTCPYCGEYVEG